MSDLILHCGGHPATLEQVLAIRVPEATDSYRPVTHGQLIDLVKDRVARETGMPLIEEKYGLNRDGRQLFGVLQYQIDTDSETSLAFGLRNSYDKTLSVGICRGLNVFVCDNLSFHGSAVNIVRKHTPKVWDDVRSAVVLSTMDTEAHVFRHQRWMESLKRVPCRLDQGYEILGKATGRSIITITQFAAAMDEWKAIHTVDGYRHSEYRETGYALYQSLTEGVKHGNVRRKIEEYCNATDLVTVAMNVPDLTNLSL